MVTPSSFIPIVTSTEHNDGGANCFIKNDISHFTSFIPKLLQVKQLNGGMTKALGYGLKLIQCPTTKVIILYGLPITCHQILNAHFHLQH